MPWNDPQEAAKLFGLMVGDAARLMRKRFEQVARERGLDITRAQAAVIILLSRSEGINQVTLAQTMELEPITLVRLLDRLEAAGLVERRADPKDRRARILHLTNRAHLLLERIYLLSEEVKTAALVGFSQEERAAFTDALARVRSNLLLQTEDFRPDLEVQAIGR